MAEGALVAVTGASGYIAGQVIASLLQRGFRVRGSVRSLSNEDKTRHLKEQFPGLELFEADLLTPGSFVEGFKGCQYVMHTASPFQLQVSDPQRDLIDPALLGTENVMRAALDTPTVTRVVVTSSVAAVVGEVYPGDGYVYSEKDWNMDSTLDCNPYRFSKRVAEEKAWEMAKEQRGEGVSPLELATINPSFVLGPPKSSRTDSTSVAMIKNLLQGAFKENGAPPLCLAAVDVRDVAQAHVEAMVRADAPGKRFIVSSEEYYTPLDFVAMLKDSGSTKLEPFFNNLPDKLAAEAQPKKRISNAQAASVLGIDFAPVGKAITDMAEFLVEQGIVSS